MKVWMREKNKLSAGENAESTNKIKFSIKIKLIILFISIILLMSIINFTANFIVRSSMSKLDNMIEANIEINNVIREVKNITAGTKNNNNMAYINSYKNVAAFESQKDERAKYKDMMLDSLQQIEGSLSEIQAKYLADKESENTYKLVYNVYQTFEKSLNETFEKYEKSDLTAARVSQESTMRTGTLFINSMQDLLANVLDHNKVEKERLNSEIDNTNLALYLAILVVGLMSIGAAYIFTGRIVGTISKLAKISESIAKGNLNVEKLEKKSKDELAVLAQSFNVMTENLKELIRKITDSSVNIADYSNILKAGTEQNTRAIEQISNTVQVISDGALDQTQKSENIVDVVQNVLEGNKKAFDNAQIVLKTSDQATNFAKIGNKKMEALLHQIHSIEGKIIETQDTTETLNENVGEIKKIIDIINQIAAQINLLSLNAAIEAARAGEFGKGFEVVADEIRKLARNSEESTADITAMLQSIQAQSEDVAVSMTDGVEEVKECSKMALEAQESFDGIQKINIDVEDQVKHINDEIQKMVEGISKVEEMSQSISHNAQQLAAGNQDAAAAVEEQTASMQEILSSSIDLSNMAEELRESIERFSI